MATKSTDTTKSTINNAGTSPAPREAHPRAGGDIYQTVTNQIITLIEQGLARGGKPQWHGQGGAAGMPYNYRSGKQYNGVNVLILWINANTRGFGSSAWLTYKQARELGGNVRKGEKGAHIVYFEPLKREEIDRTTGEKSEKVIPMPRQYVVFNMDQIEGIAPAAAQAGGFNGIEAAEAVLARSGANIIEGGARAFFSPSRDEIHLPDRVRFDTAETFYAVALHELTHWSGHTSRLARDFSGRFGDEAYAFEELIAELGAAFSCAELGLIPATMEDHAGYIENWLRVLKKDKRAIFTAASQASKAHGYIVELANREERAAA